AYFLRDVGGESVIVTRDHGDALHAFYNVCRHRGTRLCEAVEGTFSGMIRCPYHAWVYNLEGELVAAPQMDDVSHFRKEDYPLAGIKLSVWDGHIFLNLGNGPQVLAEQLTGLPEKFRPWDMEKLRLGKRIVYHVAANWKLVVQNYSECLHC